MAKVDLLQALAVLADSGIELSEEQQTALEEFKSKALSEAAEKVFGRKLTIAEGEKSDEKVSEWVTDMFDLAALVNDNVKVSTVAKGRGHVEQHLFGIDTPHGHLRVELTRKAEGSAE